MAGDEPTRRDGDGVEIDDDELEGWGSSADQAFNDKTPPEGAQQPAPPLPRQRVSTIPGHAAPLDAMALGPDGDGDAGLEQPPYVTTQPLFGLTPEDRGPDLAGIPGIEPEAPPVRETPPPSTRRRRRSSAVEPVVEPAAPPRTKRPPTAEATPAEPPASTPPPRSRRGSSELTPELPPPPIDIIPLEGAAPEGEGSWLQSFQAFKNESQRLARMGKWKQLAAVTGTALLRAPYARRINRAGLLLDLARIYRDRLDDERRAEQAFAILADEDPANAEAVGYLVEVYERRGEWGDSYDLYLKTAEATWDPNERLSCTERAANIAAQQLGNLGLAIRAWEQLWNLGDAVEVAARELSRLYRQAGRWSDLASFLRQQAARQEGAAQLVILRELAEVLLSGLHDPDGASQVLEQIVERSPKDPIALLQLARVYAQRKDWSALERLGQQAASREVPAAATLDLQHLVADALWVAGRREQAVAAYDRILEVDPIDHVGTNRKLEHLTGSGRYDELLGLLIAKADGCEDDEERATVLARAAELAEQKLVDYGQAAKLWERRITIDAEHLPSFEALTRLYEAMTDLRGVARALEGQLALTRERRARIQLLHRLGEHYATRMGDDERAEGCWKEILSLDPADLAAREELISLHRRRGDFESLNSALLRQLWLTADPQRAEKLARLAAENLDENFKDAERSLEAWSRVLDYVPHDLQALQAMAPHYAALNRRHELIASLERQILVLEDPASRIDRALEVASLWESEEQAKAASAALERVLQWDPVNGRALEGLVRIYRQVGQEGRAIGALEHAASLTVDTRQRVSLLRKVLKLLPAKDHVARFFHLRRILHLSGDRSIVDELAVEAEAAKLWNEMAALLIQLVCEQTSTELRLGLLRQLAHVLEHKLDSRERALLALESVLLAPDNSDAVLEDLSRLAEETGRHEDLLAVLDRLTTPEFDLDRRKEVIRRRAAICEKAIADPARAFQELRRLLELDPSDWGPLQDLERLAKEKSLWVELDAAFAELGDRAHSTRDRLDLLGRREQIARERLNQLDKAFDLAVRRYRLDLQNLDLLKKLTDDAETLKAWDWLLPLVEATQLQSVTETTAHELAIAAALYEGKLGDNGRAFALYSLAFMLAPDASEMAGRLEELAGRTDRFDLLAGTLRVGAAESRDGEVTIGLLRRIAFIYEQKLNAANRAIDIHRRLLSLKEDEMPSLEVMIEWHRNHNQWRDLRDRLHQWVRLTPDKERRAPKLLEIAVISEKHLQDPESALETYGEILALDAENAEARQGMNGLVAAITEPGLRMRWLRMQLRTATSDRATELRLDIARIQEEDLDDAAAAIETLRGLVAESGPDGPGFAPLRRLLQKGEHWKELVLLLQSKAEASTDSAVQRAALDEAVTLLHEHLADGEEALRESLYRAVLKLEPGNREIAILLARLLRRAGRFEELCQLLQAQLEHGSSADRVNALYELAQVKSANLELAADAESSWQRILELEPGEEGAILALARTALQRGDLRGYVSFRQKQARLLQPREAALVLCYLAEFCDENEGLGEMMVPFYREARALDANNVPAMEALKGIGRRLKNLRPAAALLPLDGERQLQSGARAERLHKLGDDSLAADLSQAVEWYHRAVAIDPDSASHWWALSEALVRQTDQAGVHRARLAWMQAFDRTEALDPQNLAVKAERLFQVGQAARAAGLEEVYAIRVRQAYDLVPSHAASALAAALSMIEQGQIQEAHKLLHTILTQYRSELNDAQRVLAHFNRGITLRGMGQQDEAMDDIREALRLQPLHADALVAMGDMQAATGRVAAALEHLIRAVVVAQDPKARADLYYRLGVLWEDGLGAHEEAGACYELAVAEGLTQRDLLHRSLRHFQRSGRLDQSLEVVNGLLPTAVEPDELATLWLVRGEIYSAREGRENEAIEAFDMALSYDPARQEARDGLAMVLERREDWTQLLEVLEATCDGGTAAQQSAALLRMADICNSRLGDARRAEDYLRRAVKVMPTREALEQLERVYTIESGRLEERKEILGLLAGFGPPWFSRAIELARILLATDKPWAWCLISPLLGVSQVEPDLKAVVQAMRKEYERPPVRCCKPDDIELLRHPDAHAAVAQVLADLGTRVRPLGASSLDAAGDGGALAISESTTLGKTFAIMANSVGLKGCSLYRTQDLPESIAVINADPNPMVVVRTDVIQQLVHAEVGFLFAYGLEQAKPGHRVMAALSRDNRDQLLPALWAAVGFKGHPGKLASKLAERIKESTDEAIRADWAEKLQHLSDRDPLELGRSWWQGVCATARRAGLLAGADLRQVFRVVSRLEADVPRPRVVARVEELDDYVSVSPVLQDLVAFAASPAFGQLLRSGVEPSEP